MGRFQGGDFSDYSELGRQPLLAVGSLGTDQRCLVADFRVAFHFAELPRARGTHVYNYVASP